MMAENSELSERELEILQLVATGASNKEIAQKLYISTNTVKVHLRNIFGKIGAASRTEAAMHAVKLGLVQTAAGEEYLSGTGDGGGLSEQGKLLPFPSSILFPNIAPTWLRLALIAVVLLFIGGTGLGLYLAFGQRANPGNVINNPANAFTNSPLWELEAALPTDRYAFASVVYDSQIYAISGDSAQGLVNSVELYDPIADHWTGAEPKPTAVRDIQAAAVGGRIYVPGGRLSSGEVTDILEIYDPLSASWETGPPLPVALSAYALATFEGKFFVFGGWDGSQYVASVYEYDPVAASWSEHTPMPTPRGFSGAVNIGSKIYVLGGVNQSGPLAVNEIYSPILESDQKQSWETGTPMPEARYAMGVAGVVDLIYLIGGVGAEEGGDLPSQVFFQQTGEWQLITPPTPDLGSHLSLVNIGTYLYLLGGANEGESSNRNLSIQALYTVSVPFIVK